MVQVARGRAIIPANRKHLELEPTIIGAHAQAALRRPVHDIGHRREWHLIG